MKPLMTLLAFCICFNLASQAQQMQVLNAYHHYKPKASTDYHDLLFLVRNSLEKKVDGDPYFNDWEDALLVVESDKIYSVRARYRLLDDEFQINLNGSVKALHPHLIEGIVFRDYVFVSGTELKTDGSMHGFYELLVSGDVPLLKKYSLNQKVRKDGVIEVKNQETAYYFTNASNRVEALTAHANHLSELFEHQQKVKTYCKAHRISMKKEETLKDLFQYANGL